MPFVCFRSELVDKLNASLSVAGGGRGGECAVRLLGCESITTANSLSSV